LPVYLLTIHTHGSWLPDHPKGYVARGKGIQTTNHKQAENYRSAMKTPAVSLTPRHQNFVLENTKHIAAHLDAHLHAIAIDPTHVHTLLSWHGERNYLTIRRALKQALTRKLNEQFNKRKWWSAGGSRKRVKDRQHLKHLVETYLPSHHQTFWSESTRCPLDRHDRG